MTEDLLRRWVRSELPPAERREVSRWIVQCSSPALGPLLHGILREERDRVADAALARRGDAWSRLVGAWDALLASGRAALSDGHDVVLASTDPDAPALTLTRTETGLFAELRAGPPAVSAAVYLTDDSGRVALLAQGAPGEVVRVALPDDLGERSTVWAVWGSPRLAPGPAAALSAALAAPEATVAAVRLLPEG